MEPTIPVTVDRRVPAGCGATRRRALAGLSSLSLLLALGTAARPAGAADSSTADCLAANDASFKYDNQHRFRAERAELLTCAASSCPADIRRDCVRRVDEVNAAIPTIMFETKDAAGNDLLEVRVKMDDEVIAERLEGVALAIDPGAHTFVFDAGGRAIVRKQFLIRQGHKNRIERIVFESLGRPAAPPVASVAVQPHAAGRRGAAVAAAHPGAGAEPPGRPPVPGAPAVVEAGPASAGRDGWGVQRTLALTATVIGVVGVGVGAVFGAQAISRRDDAQKICPTVCVDQAGVDAWHDARLAGNRATTAFIAGGSSLAIATVLWLTSGSSSRHEVAASGTVGPGEVGLALGGRW